MLQHLLRRLVFDVPILNEYAKMPLKVRGSLNIFLKVPMSSSTDFLLFTFLKHPTAFDKSLWTLLEILLPS